jgi:hypothetical protein
LASSCKQKAEGKPLTITNDGEQRRDFTYCQRRGTGQPAGGSAGMASSTSAQALTTQSMSWPILSAARKNTSAIGARARLAIHWPTIRQAKHRAGQPSVDIKDWIHDQIQS